MIANEILQNLFKLKLISYSEYIRTNKNNKPVTGVANHLKAQTGDLSWTPGKYNEEFPGALLISANSRPCSHNHVISPNPKLAMVRAIEYFKPNLYNIFEPDINNCQMGLDITIGSYSSIGIAGQGYAKDGNKWIRFPHLGRVIIHDNVEIGTNTNICRGVIDDTIIHEGVKIGNFVDIGHNVIIGKNSVVVAGAIVCGGCVIGENVWIGPGAIINKKIKVGNNALVSVGAVVIRDVPAGTTVIGNPARVIPAKPKPEQP